ncbi:MAG: hypothetical protein Q9227_003714 [Pyrenula ochraceoflavens]
MSSIMRFLGLTVLAVGLAVAQEASGAGGSGGSKGASQGGGGGGSSEQMSPAAAAEKKFQNSLLQQYGMDLLIALAAVVGALAVYRVIVSTSHHIRMLACLNSNTQRYFAIPHDSWARIKKDVIYAPMFRVRHNREFRLSSAVNMGTLPTRFQAIFMIGVLTMNILLCVYMIPFMDRNETSVLKYLRNRTGTIATVNLIPLVLMADRGNPLIKMLNISFDSFNMMHRFFGRLVVLEVVAHTLCWIISEANEAGSAGIGKAISNSKLIMTGFIAAVLFVAISIQALSPLRHAFYEFFLHFHIVLAAVAFTFVYMHLDGLPQQAAMIGAIGGWVGARFGRLVNLIWRNFGRRGNTKAMIELLPGDAMRVTFRLARPWSFKPGQHMYVTIPSVGLWTSHPFTVAWSDVETPLSKLSLELDPEKGQTTTIEASDPVLAKHPTYISAIMRRRTGFTSALYKKAEKANAWNGTKLTLSAFVEGPFGVTHPMSSYGTVLLFAAGVGITHQVPYVRSLVAGYANGTVAARRILLVWVIQSPEHLEWIRPWMTQILGMEGRRDILRIQLFITRPRSAKEVHSPSSTVQMFPGRPDIETLVRQECENGVGCMGVSSCGTGELQDVVRRSVRGQSLRYNVEYVEESFTW